MKTAAYKPVEQDEFDLSPSETSAGSHTGIKFPDFGGGDAALIAVTAKLAGRINAASVSDQEHKELLRERQALLDKKLDGTINRQEENRLAYVRWSLDRIEDAKYGHSLDKIDDAVQMYQRFVDQLHDFHHQLEGATKRR